jgi:hypothetical protein
MLPGVSLSKLGLVAVDGLDCPEGGLHHIREPELIIASAEGGGEPRCLKCGQAVMLRSNRELD